MKDKEICKEVVETLLGIKVGKIEFLTSQYEIEIDPEAKTIAMDVRWVRIANEQSFSHWEKPKANVNINERKSHSLDVFLRKHFVRLCYKLTVAYWPKNGEN